MNLKQYELQIEAWHLFYESFVEYDNAIMLANGVLVDMQSKLIKAKIKNPTNIAILDTEARIKTLFTCIEKFEGLNARCVRLQTKLKQTVNTNLILEQELNDIKKAHNEQD